MLKNKKILLGVTGSISAYKAVYLVRLLVKQGADVRVVLTNGAKDFVTALTFSTVSKNEVYSDFYDADSGVWANHIDLALWADIILIAPASANEIAKMANGICDNLLTAIYLSARSKVIFAPAMDLDMYAHNATQENIKKLISFGNLMIEPSTGELASGLVGKGRLSEPDEIVNYLINFFSKIADFKGKKVLITAGPTQEAIDPVRFISNHSSGKMGFAIAEEFAERGAEVILISGKTELKLINQNIKIIKVVSGDDMYMACEAHFASVDIMVFSAAVADYKVKNIATQKIKKSDSEFAIELVKNVDIAYEFGKRKQEKQISVGFALETNNELENAKSKLEKKNFDMVVLNSTQDKGATFGSDFNKISIIHKHNTVQNFELKPKNEVAKDIVNEVIKLL